MPFSIYQLYIKKHKYFIFGLNYHYLRNLVLEKTLKCCASMATEVCYNSISLGLPLQILGAQWLSGRVLDLRQRGHGFEPHCVVSPSKTTH